MSFLQSDPETEFIELVVDQPTEGGIEISMNGFQCNAVCPYCSVTQNCPKEPNHYGSHLCPTGHGF
jgi:hypothetical protein